MMRRAGQNALVLGRSLSQVPKNQFLWRAPRNAPQRFVSSGGAFGAVPRASLLGARSRISNSPSRSCNCASCNRTPGRGLTAQSFSSVAAGEGKEIEFKLADIGEGIAEVELLEWFVESGQTISQFDKVCQVQSDKASVEITSRYDGVVTELAYEVGDMAAVGSTLIKLRSTSADVDEPSTPNPQTSSDKASTPAAPAAPAASSSAPVRSGKVLTSPAVRRIAKERDLDLTLVPGSGPNGRILKSDVLNFDPSAVSAAPKSVTPVSPVHTPAPRAPSGVDSVHKVTGIQRVMVQSMTAAASVPTFGFNDEICVDKLVELRKSIKEMEERKHKLTGEPLVKVSYMPFIMKAMSLALNQYPSLNAHVNSDCSEVIHRGSHNIALAMDTPRGLLVPNVKNCQDKSVVEIAAELNRLQALGAKGQLGAEDLSGGTVTLSNIGSIGGTYAIPILVVPEVVIGALGKFQKLPRFDEDLNVKPTTIMNVSWSADHRVVDGATMARFSNQWKEYLENPYSMLASMS